MHSVHLTSQSWTKDFFHHGFIFFLIATITNGAEMDQIPDMAKAIGKKCSILKRIFYQNPYELCKFFLLSFGRVTVLTMQ